MNKIKFFIYLILILILNIGYNTLTIHYQTKTIDNTRKLIEKQDSLLNSKQSEIDSTRVQFQRLLESLEFISKVDVTMYNAVPAQTDNTPFITASGARINPDKATEHRWIAISRDLQERWGGPLDFGDIVYIKGAGIHDGLYMVQDNMNPRYTNRVDILRTEGDSQFAFIGKNIELYRVKENTDVQYADNTVDKWDELHNHMKRMTAK